MFTKTCRIGNDPMVAVTSTGTSYLKLSLAYSYGRKVDGQYPTQWINATMWGKQAESLVQYINKGDQCEVSIKDLHNHEHNDKTYLQGDIVEFNFVSSGKPKDEATENPNKAPDNFPDDSELDIPF